MAVEEYNIAYSYMVPGLGFQGLVAMEKLHFDLPFIDYCIKHNTIKVPGLELTLQSTAICAEINVFYMISILARLEITSVEAVRHRTFEYGV